MRLSLVSRQGRPMLGWRRWGFLSLAALSLALGACASPAPTPTATPPLMAAGARFPGLGYGMQVLQGPDADFNRAVGLLKGAGFGWMKIQLRWEYLEQTKGNINWPLIDQVVYMAEKNRVKLLISVVTAPRWARPPDSDFSVPGPPADPRNYANFVRDIAARHKDRISAIEVWNEQNLWYEWGGKGKLSAVKYMDLLKASYQAIKSVAPNVVVVSGALTPTGVDDGVTAIDDVRYLRLMYEAGLATYSDAIGAHPSGFNNPPDDDMDHHTVSSTAFKNHSSFYFRRFEQYYEVMKEFGDRNKQLWFTEFGWASARPAPPGYEYAADNSEEDQARYLVRAFEIAKEKGYVGPVFLWNLNFAPIEPPADPVAKAAFGILRRDWSLRPAYEALKQMPK